jgi:hypothetical protein
MEVMCLPEVGLLSKDFTPVTSVRSRTRNEETCASAFSLFAVDLRLPNETGNLGMKDRKAGTVVGTRD